MTLLSVIGFPQNSLVSLGWPWKCLTNPFRERVDVMLPRQHMLAACWQNGYAKDMELLALYDSRWSYVWVTSRHTSQSKTPSHTPTQVSTLSRAAHSTQSSTSCLLRTRPGLRRKPWTRSCNFKSPAVNHLPQILDKQHRLTMRIVRKKRIGGQLFNMKVETNTLFEDMNTLRCSQSVRELLHE